MEELIEETLSEYEIERGKPMPSRNHNRIQNRLNFELTKLYEGEYDFLPEQDIELLSKWYVPDLCIFPNLIYDWLHDEIRMTIVPITTIEILSPKQNLTDLTDKILNVYFPAGVQSAWLIIPPLNTLHIFYPDQTMQTFISGIIHDNVTNIELNLSDIFR